MRIFVGVVIDGGLTFPLCEGMFMGMRNVS